MATRTPIKEEKVETPEADRPQTRRRFWFGASGEPRPSFSQVMSELHWRLLLIVGLVGGVLWALLLSREDFTTFFAGLLPVAGGIWVGRKITQHVGWHAIVLSLTTIVGALVMTAVLVSVGVVSQTFLAQVIVLGMMALLPFPAFGVFTSYRSEQRNRLLRAERERRGGKLERPGRVKSIEELRSLSLPQLGGYVADLFRKHDFQVKDFQFGRDNSIEFDMRHNEEPWVIKVTVDDKVKQGTVLQFLQRLRESENPRGVMITSMTFQDAAQRWAKDKPVALIDGPTLMSMND